MGIDEVRVRPAYFPYTEPSLEIEVKWKGKWLELGGAGIFRPEVTEPLGCKWPVCAWGMGLERLAMLVLGLDDIRQFRPEIWTFLEKDSPSLSLMFRFLTLYVYKELRCWNSPDSNPPGRGQEENPQQTKARLACKINY